jgi:hypothetical protein
VGIADQSHDGEHVIGERCIDAPEVCRIPSAVFFCVVPGKQEVGDAASLPGILLADPEQSLEGVPTNRPKTAALVT